MRKIEFEERAVAFLDILGFKEFITSAEKVGSHEYKKLCELQDVIEAQIDLTSERADEEGRNFLPEKKLRCTYISDSIILSAPIGEGCFSGLTVVAIKTIQIAHQLLKMGFLMRGGIAVGCVFHSDRNIFGTGYVNAYQTQEKDACTPRVLLHESAVKILDSDGKHFGYDNDSCWEKEHDQRIVNTLSPHWSHIGGKDQCPNALFQGYGDTIIGNLNKHPLGGSVRGKWEWMAGYFNEILKHNRGIQGIAPIALPFPPSSFRSGVISEEANRRSFIADFSLPPM